MADVRTMSAEWYRNRSQKVRRRLSLGIALVVVLGMSVTLGPAVKAGYTLALTLNGASLGETFNGIGALNQGGQERMLYDYPEPQRSQLLDFLFSPSVNSSTGQRQPAGAAFQTLKVELGGDGMSGEGSEPSHARTQQELSNAQQGQCNYRGYEWWLMQQAKARNPQIKLEALPWTYPNYLGSNFYSSSQSTSYVVTFLKCAQAKNLPIDYVWVLNEDAGTNCSGSCSPAGLQYMKNLAQAIQQAGLATQIICCDDAYQPYVTDMQNDSSLASAIGAIGAHYPDTSTTGDIESYSQTSGKPLVASEESASVRVPFGNEHLVGEWVGAMETASAINRNFATCYSPPGTCSPWLGGDTRDEMIFYLNGFYDSLYAPGAGFISAYQPWSGHYDVQPAVWAIAHTTQFTSPGWHYLNLGTSTPGCLNATQQCSGGSYVALTSDDSNHDYSVILETCSNDMTSTSYNDRPVPCDSSVAPPQQVTGSVQGGLSSAQVNVWESTISSQFQLVATLPVTGGSWTYAPTGGLVSDAIYTFSTLAGEGKLATGTIPPPARFCQQPCNSTYTDSNYLEDFNSYQIGDDLGGTTRHQPDYIATQVGSFELQPSSVCTQSPGWDGTQCLEQVVSAKPYHAFDDTSNPYAIVGDRSWTDYTESVVYAFPPSVSNPSASIDLLGRVQEGADNGLDLGDFSHRGSYDANITEGGTLTVYRRWTYEDSTCGCAVENMPLKVVGGPINVAGAAGHDWHTLQMTLNGTTISLYVDDLTNPVLTFNDTGGSGTDVALLTGMIGIGTGWNTALFDNLTVNQINNSSNQYDERSSYFSYTGTWSQCGSGPSNPCNPSDLDFNGTITSSDTMNDVASFTFTGTRVILFGTGAINGGIGCVSIDATPGSGNTCASFETLVDFFHESQALGDQVLYISPLLTSGSHTLRLRVAGNGEAGQSPLGAPGVNYCHIDRADVLT